MRILISLLVLLFLISCEPKLTPECGAEIQLSKDLFDNGPIDPFLDINSMNWDGSCLKVSVSYGGGCEEHFFEYAIDGSILKTDPPILELSILHNDTDLCEAYITEELSFGLGDHEVFKTNPIMYIKIKGNDFQYLLEQ